MSLFSSTHKRQDSLAVSRSAGEATTVTLGEGSLIVIALVRIFVGYLWFQQIFWKMPPNFAGLHKYLVEESHYAFFPGYASFVQHVFLPNFILLGASVWLAELLVSLSLMFGVFSRLGALLATILAIQLYIGLAVAPGEWYWTYGMLVLLGIVLSAMPAGRRLGLDQWLAPQLRTGTPGRWRSILGWFV